MPPAWAALGYRFALAEPADEVVEALSGLPSADDGVPLHLTEPGSAGLSELVSRLNLGAIAAEGGALLLHAGAVARADGGVAVLCGPSGSGKSTLTVRLAQRGLHYLTDEVVRLDPHTLRLTPFRKPVSVKTGGQAALAGLSPSASLWAKGPWLVPPSAFETAPPPERPLLPRLLVFPTYRSGAELAVEELTEAETAFLLGRDSSRLSEVDGGPLPALARLARRARGVRLLHGNAVDAAPVVHELLEAA